MIDFQERAEREKLQAECKTLEAEADIVQAMSRAREGRFIPLGIDGEKCSPEAHFADEQDHFREHARDAYFAVRDAELRKKLIRAQRKLDYHISRVLDNDVKKLQGELLRSTANANQQPWAKAAVVAVAVVACGYWVYQGVGALAGAIGGYFLGQGVISNAKADAQAEISQALDALAFAESSRGERMLWPETFSIEEELSGIRDNQLDKQSAYANVLQRERGG